jgi:hypothetical protein
MAKRYRLLLTLCAIYTCVVNVVVGLSFDLANLRGEIVEPSGVLKSLRPVIADTFDFSPSDFFSERNRVGNYHTGDLLLSYRPNGEKDWVNVDTAKSRAVVNVSQSDNSSSEVCESDLSSAVADASVNVTRRWSDHEGDLVLTFKIVNNGDKPLEIGGLGFPFEVNNIFTDRTPEEVSQKCSLADPYVGLDAGYVQVTPLSGEGPALVVTPFLEGTRFEAWEFLDEDTGSLAYRSNQFEGNFAWLSHSKAFSEQFWGDAEPWNEPSSRTLAVGEEVSYGLRFTVAESIHQIEDTISSIGLPVAVGIPGYVLPKGVLGKLFINSTSEPLKLTTSPSGALEIEKDQQDLTGDWTAYSVKSLKDAFGRVYLEIEYENGTTQTVHYWIANDVLSTIESIGEHSENKNWYAETSDAFRRAPGFLTFNKKTDSVVLQDNRTWIAGISDDGGAGSFVTVALKQIIQPVKSQVALLEEFVDKTVWGGPLQISEDGDDRFAVRKSLFYYDREEKPDYEYDSSIEWDNAWNSTEANKTDRAYNYVHFSLLYWSLYKSEKVQPGVLTSHNASWYLEQSAGTVIRGLDSEKSLYTDMGLMGESIWLELLSDLYSEGHESTASHLESIMRKRQETWSSQAIPFGSEQAWDCTGQEGVYVWSQYFNDSQTAEKTINSIRGYDPAIAHWAYNGNARRYWDFTTAGEMPLASIERQVHHYGSSLNALPLLDWYKRVNEPSSLENLYQLRVGYGGSMAVLSNVDQNGFTSMAFHSHNSILTWDGYSGDYGSGFVGNVLGSACYLVKHPVFGYLAFGGNLSHDSDGTITVHPYDTLRRQLYIAPFGLDIRFETGTITSFTWSEDHLEIHITSSGPSSVSIAYQQTSQVLRDGQIEISSPADCSSDGLCSIQYDDDGKAIVSFSKV